MKNIINKINITLIIIFLIVLFSSNYSYATISNIFSDADSFLGKRFFCK